MCVEGAGDSTSLMQVEVILMQGTGLRAWGNIACWAVSPFVDMKGGSNQKKKVVVCDGRKECEIQLPWVCLQTVVFSDRKKEHLLPLVIYH